MMSDRSNVVSEMLIPAAQPRVEEVTCPNMSSTESSLSTDQYNDPTLTSLKDFIETDPVHRCRDYDSINGTELSCNYANRSSGDSDDWIIPTNLRAFCPARSSTPIRQRAVKLRRRKVKEPERPVNPFDVLYRKDWQSFMFLHQDTSSQRFVINSMVSLSGRYIVFLTCSAWNVIWRKSRAVRRTVKVWLQFLGFI